MLLFCSVSVAISQEKQEVELRESIGKHDRSSLKKVETTERDALKESKLMGALSLPLHCLCLYLKTEYLEIL